jgi:hypothetical protein
MTWSQISLVYGIFGVLISIVAYYDSVDVLLKDKQHLTRRVLGMLNWIRDTSLRSTKTPTDWVNPYATTWLNYPLWIRIAKFEPTTSEVTLEYKLNWGCLQELLLIALAWGVLIIAWVWIEAVTLIADRWEKLTSASTSLPLITFTTRVIYDDSDGEDGDGDDIVDSNDGH